MKKSQSEFHDIRGLRYHVRIWGEAQDPPLFLLHGWMDVSASFQFLVDSLRGRWRVIAPDWRGCGLTGWADAGYWFPDYYADLDALLDVYTPAAPARTDALGAWGFAIAAGVAIKLAIMAQASDSFYARNASLFVLPLLIGYFAWKRALDTRTLVMLGMGVVAAAVFANAYPFAPEGSTEILTALHLPVALWLGVGIAYAGGRWSQVAGRMDFIRFSGELLIYYALIALGGGVITGFMAMIFEVIGIDIEPFMENWFPCLVAGAVIVAAWLVEAKQSVVENMAPVLTRLFTPIVILLLLAFLGTLAFTARGINVERDALLAFDVLLLLVLALFLYTLSARDASAPAGPFDILQVVLLVSALLADAFALWAIGARISEFGFTPNRVAVLGINLILLVNLAWSALLYLRFLRGQASFAALEKWQTGYLPVYAGWAAVVVVGFPVVFGYV